MIPIQPIKSFSMILVVLLSFIGIVSCKPREATSTPTSGKLRIVCDEAISSIMALEIATFEKNYPQADITMTLAPAGTAVIQLLNNEVDFIASSRELDSSETFFLIKNDIKVYSQKIAMDGLAVIVNRNNPLNHLNMDQLKKILTGQILTWNQLSDSISFPGNIRNIQVVFDGYRSGNYTLLRNQILDRDGIVQTAFMIIGDSATSSSVRIIDFVAEHPNAIGYISTSLLNKQTNYNSPMDSIKVLRLSNLDYHKPVAPIPGYIYRGDYPLRRMLYVMNRQTFAGLGAGFVAFLTGNEGQRVFLNADLVPAVNPIRLKTE
jgi:phosphate transport system substrate-binding protein